MKIDQWRPLTHLDDEDRTLGCRHSNPNICKNNATPEKCAFVREDQVCLLPPRSWSGILAEIKRRAAEVDAS